MYCPVCKQDLFSRFDKLYIERYGVCFTCDSKNTPKKEYMKRAEKIFAEMEL